MQLIIKHEKNTNINISNINPYGNCNKFQNRHP